MFKRILYTFANDIYWVESDKGARYSLTASQLVKEVGEKEFARLNRIAQRLPGHWHWVPCERTGSAYYG